MPFFPNSRTGVSTTFSAQCWGKGWAKGVRGTACVRPHPLPPQLLLYTIDRPGVLRNVNTTSLNQLPPPATILAMPSSCSPLVRNGLQQQQQPQQPWRLGRPQATLHFPPAFWGMLLPVTVHGRVSDIWRSYFTQTLLPSTGAVAAFGPAWVEQVRKFAVVGQFMVVLSAAGAWG